MRPLAIYDLELSIPVEQGGGWGAARRGECGMACAIVMLLPACQIRLFDRRMVGELSDALNECEMVAGHNIEMFDNPIVEALSKRSFKRPIFDLFARIKSAAGSNGKGWGLGKISDAMLGRSTIAEHDGAEVPQMWQAGRWAEVFQKCLGDVVATAAILSLAVKGSGLITNGTDNVRIDVNPLLPFFKPHAMETLYAMSSRHG